VTHSCSTRFRVDEEVSINQAIICQQQRSNFHDKIEQQKNDAKFKHRKPKEKARLFSRAY